MSLFDARNVSGIIARLEQTLDGGAHIVTWEGPEKGWMQCPPGSIDVHELMKAPPASDRLMAEVGIPADDAARASG